MATTYESLPEAIAVIAKQQVLDTIGVALAGYAADGVRQLREFTAAMGGRPESRIWGSPVAVPAHEAARVNGAMAHALDYDDTHEKSYVHPSVITIPAVLAVAEKRPGVTGRDIIVATALGTDLSCRLAMAAQPGVDPFKVGWHNTTVYGYISSALAAGKLLGLSRQQMIDAAGIAYHQAAGNAQAHVDGALTKRMGPGFAGSAGVLAAQLAQSGVSGARQVLEGPIGLYRQYHGGDYDRSRLLDGLGSHFAAADLSFKPYPSCRGSHTAVDAALAIRGQQGFPVSEIAAITIQMGPGEYKLLGTPIEAKRRPRSNVQAQFSNPWIVATTLLDGRLSLADFSPAALDRPEVLALTAKTHTALDASLLAEGGGVGPTRLTVELRDGRRYIQTVRTAKGEPNQPLSVAEFEQKFSDCARSAGLAAGQAAALMSTILGLERLTDARALTRQMIPA
ncbi:MmgE/PrpD family protein [Bordetella pseudohinzii]|uniref:MmgE/PrpD family protein n=1 Tax=Bordetella pseudohinzii TaxID=1331258 RepID=A0ABN4RX01_9BORD|nr:MmgE/PrpD family protein [Bordetella pseudohinzii]KMM26118.1 MmgE/PrpD family protein [Bordetella pseudohinzii]KXA75671.1 MmgE/PrpD family protein [Bordetella pseudohinzii]KXA82941.1 MmgE/PrpD family protein [Bordetella pseudohinzii]